MKGKKHILTLSLGLYALLLLLLWTGCKSLSSTEVAEARKSQDALCQAVLNTYRSQDMKAFSQLALSPGQIKEMMSKVQVPESAKRETIHNKAAFSAHVQDSLQHVLAAAKIDWAQAEFVRFAPQRKPIEIAPGYKMCLGRMVVKAGEKRLSQPFSVVEADGGKFFVGDFGPFEPEN